MSASMPPAEAAFLFDGEEWRLESDPNVTWTQYFERHHDQGARLFFRPPAKPPVWTVAHVKEVLKQKAVRAAHDAEGDRAGSWSQAYDTGVTWALNTALMYLCFIDDEVAR